MGIEKLYSKTTKRIKSLIKGGRNMKCPKCGSKLDTGYNCTKCDYRYRKIEDTTKMTYKQIKVIDGEFMERLTVNKGQEYDGTADMLKVYYRLADYEDIGTVDDFKDLKAGAETLNLKGDEILLKPFEVKGFVYDSEEYKQLKAENESLKKQLEEQRKKVTMMNGLLPKSRCETPIEELDLSTRPYNCLWRAGISTIEQLQQMPEEKLLRLRNLGRKSLSEIKSKLADNGKEE
jgi:hypothetical protein